MGGYLCVGGVWGFGWNFSWRVFFLLGGGGGFTVWGFVFVGGGWEDVCVCALVSHSIGRFH
jgi:hypothetical protein